MKVTDKITITNEDNMELMARYPDNYFDLAIVDPPYGIDVTKMTLGNAKNKLKSKEKDWDIEVPNELYFTELFRVSRNQLIWGGNYFKLPNSRFWIVWDKNNGESDFADGEMCWGSFNKPMRIKRVNWCGSACKHETGKNKIHPTQKPVALYKWIFEKYGKPDFKYLDTHVGSGSIAIAFDEMLNVWDLAGHDITNAELTACELDKDYFDATIKRLNNKFGNSYTFDDAPDNQTNIFGA